MPFYEYQCLGCGKMHEDYFARIPDEIPTHKDGCCGTLERRFSPTHIIMPVYRHTELQDKNDGPGAHKHYTEKLHLIDE